MGELIAWLHALPSNPMFAGITGAAVISGLLVAARRVPAQLWQWSLMAVSAQVTVKSQDPVFWWIVNWLSESTYGKTSRRMRLESTAGNMSDAPAPAGVDREEVRYVLSPADGVHWFFHRCALLVVSRSKEQSGGTTGSTSYAREEIHVRAFTLGSREYIAALIHEAQQSLKSDEDCTRVHHNEHWNWSSPTLVPKRPIESVILRAGVAETLVDDARTFMEAKQWYRDRCIPWRRGYLLHGAPGCGKSSIAHALATELGMNIAILALASVAGDSALRSIMASMPPKCLLLVEDIDAAFNQREGKEVEHVTFSGVLNAIDGIAAAEGRILVMTTNHPEKLDAALRRAGRCDIEMLIDVADAEQGRRMFARFFPGEESAARAFGLRHMLGSARRQFKDC